MNKIDLLVEEVELIQANPHHAHVHYQKGKKITVSTRYLAPVEIPINEESQKIYVDEVEEAQEIPIDAIGDYSALQEKPLLDTPTKPGNTTQSMSNPTDAAKEVLVPRRSGCISWSTYNIWIYSDGKYFKEEENLAIYLFTPTSLE